MPEGYPEGIRGNRHYVLFTILFILNWGLIYSPKKEEATERSDVDFEIGDLGTFAHV